MRQLILIPLIFIFTLSSAQVKEVLETEKKILTAFERKDTMTLKELVADQFIMVSADGSITSKAGFISAYSSYRPEDKLTIKPHLDRSIINDNVIILHGFVINQWQEGQQTAHTRIPYTDTYQKKNGKWILISSFVNDTGEDYFSITDTTGVRNAIAKQYAILDRSVETKDLNLHLSLKTMDFNTVDHLGNPGSPQFMRNRSKILFSAIRDSVETNSTIESIEFAGDTAKATVFQEFKRNQMAGGKVRYMETTARQRESWMLTRDGWKLVFVDKVIPLSRIANGIPTDPLKPVNWNDPAFK